MMRYVLFSFALLFSVCLFAQDNNNKKVVDDHLYLVGHNMIIPKYHHRVELESLKKSTLSHLYIKRVRILEELLPFMCLKAGPRLTLTMLHVPENKKNLKIRDKHYKMKAKYLDKKEKDLRAIVNYSDKERIVEAIITIESIIWQIQKFRDGDMHHEEVH